MNPMQYAMPVVTTMAIGTAVVDVAALMIYPIMAAYIGRWFNPWTMVSGAALAALNPPRPC